MDLTRYWRAQSNGNKIEVQWTGFRFRGGWTPRLLVNGELKAEHKVRRWAKNFEIQDGSVTANFWGKLFRHRCTISAGGTVLTTMEPIGFCGNFRRDRLIPDSCALHHHLARHPLILVSLVLWGGQSCPGNPLWGRLSGGLQHCQLSYRTGQTGPLRPTLASPHRQTDYYPPVDSGHIRPRLAVRSWRLAQVAHLSGRSTVTRRGNIYLHACQSHTALL